MAKSGIALIPRHFEEMRKRAAALHKRAQGKQFAKGDVRNAFFYNAGNLINNYCVALGLVWTGDQYAKMDEPDPIANTVAASLYGKPLFNYFLAKQRAHLFLETWCAFEDALRLLYREVVSEDVRVHDIESEKSRYVHPPKKPHIGIPVVWSRVAAVAQRGRAVSPRQRKRLIEVVDFCAATRNTIHSNTFYSGPARPLRIGKRILELKDGANTDFLSMAVLPLLIAELAAATSFLRCGIRTKRKIMTPASLLPSPY